MFCKNIYRTLCLEVPCPVASVEGLSSGFPILAGLTKIVSVVLAQFLCLTVIIRALLYPICVIKTGWLPRGHETSEMGAFSVL